MNTTTIHDDIPIPIEFMNLYLLFMQTLLLVYTVASVPDRIVVEVQISGIPQCENDSIPCECQEQPTLRRSKRRKKSPVRYADEFAG